MDGTKISKAYEAFDMLKSIGIPISKEQKNIVARMERSYLSEDVLPLIEQELQPLVANLENSFRLHLAYSQDGGLSIRAFGRIKAQTRQYDRVKPVRRQKNYIIRVLFPDNHVSCNRLVWETLMDVVRYAGAEKVMSLGINMLGNNLVSSKLHENMKYRVSQKEVEPGFYLCTLSSTDTKYEQIREINKRLNLGLRIEKQLL